MKSGNNSNMLRKLLGQKNGQERDPNSQGPSFYGGIPRSGLRLFSSWFSVDPRALALFRITYGVLLIINILRRLPYIDLMYTREGVIPNKVISDYPFSSDAFTILTSFDGPIETRIIFYTMLVFAFFFTIGWKTRLFQVLSALSLFNIHSKNILVENGGDQVMCIFMVWTLFLPLSKRFSVDSLLSSLRSTNEISAAQLNDVNLGAPNRDPVWNIAIFACLCQLAAIYFFNTVSKHGPTWTTGTALYYILHMDRQITEFAVWCRNHLPYGVGVLLTYATLVVEGAAAPLFFSPIGVTWCRRIAIISLTGLHVGIAAWMNVGLFSWAVICAYPLAMTAPDFELLKRMFRWFAQKTSRTTERLTIQYSEENARNVQVAKILKRMDRLQLLDFEAGSSWAVKRRGKVYAGFSGWGHIIHSLPLGFLTLTLTLGLLLTPVAILADPQLMELMGYESLGFAPFMEWPQYLLLLAYLYLFLRTILFFEHQWAVRLFQAIFPAMLHGDNGVTRKGGPLYISPNAPSRLRSAGFVIAQILALFLMIIASRQMFATNDYFKDTFDERPRQYSFASKLLRYPRMFNKWNMFAPNPPKGEGWIIIDACTADGRNIDIQTRQLPHFAPVSFDRGVDWGQMWRIYTKRIAKKSHRKRRPALRDYLKNIHRYNEAYKDDRLREFDVYWMRTRSPSPDQWYKPIPRDHWVYGLTGTLTNWLGTEVPGKCGEGVQNCEPVTQAPVWVRQLERTLSSWMRSEPRVASGLDEDLYDQNANLKPKVTCYKVTSHHPKTGKRMACKTNEGKSKVPKVCLTKPKDDKKKSKRGNTRKNKNMTREKLENDNEKKKRTNSRIPKARPVRNPSSLKEGLGGTRFLKKGGLPPANITPAIPRDTNRILKTSSPEAPPEKSGKSIVR